MKIVIDIPKEVYKLIQNNDYCGISNQDMYNAIKNGIPHETVTEFADRCRECGREKVLDKIRAEIKALSPEPTAYDVVDGNPIKDAVWETIADVLKIIDKYRSR